MYETSQGLCNLLGELLKQKQKLKQTHETSQGICNLLGELLRKKDKTNPWNLSGYM